MKTDVYTRLLYARQLPILGGLSYLLLKLLGAEVPRDVRFGKGCVLLHGGFGVVIHPRSTFGERVRIYPGVTLGRADIHHTAEQSAFEGIRIENDVILGTGSKILCKKGILTVGKGSVIGANAVLLQSTGENEIWAGIPARCVSKRE